MADEGGVTSMGSPGDGAEVCSRGVWIIGIVRGSRCAALASVMKGPRCTLSSVIFIVRVTWDSWSVLVRRNRNRNRIFLAAAAGGSGSALEEGGISLGRTNAPHGNLWAVSSDDVYSEGSSVAMAEALLCPVLLLICSYPRPWPTRVTFEPCCHSASLHEAICLGLGLGWDWAIGSDDDATKGVTAPGIEY